MNTHAQTMLQDSDKEKAEHPEVFPYPFMSISSIITTLHPRKSRQTRQRTTFLALFSLIAFSTYIFSVAYPSLSFAPLALRDTESTDGRSSLWTSHRKLTPSKHFAPQVELDRTQELAAITSFLASHPQNVLPLSVDPTISIDPQLVLDFDTRGPNAMQEVDAMVDDVWLRNPVVLYSKHYSPVSRQLKSILSKMNLRPGPTTFDVDTRDDAQVLLPLITRLADVTDLPILIIGGKPVLPPSDFSSSDPPTSLHTVEYIRALEASGELARMATDAGAAVDVNWSQGGKRRKGRSSPR